MAAASGLRLFLRDKAERACAGLYRAEEGASLSRDVSRAALWDRYCLHVVALLEACDFDVLLRALCEDPPDVVLAGSPDAAVARDDGHGPHKLEYAASGGFYLPARGAALALGVADAVAEVNDVCAPLCLGGVLAGDQQVSVEAWAAPLDDAHDSELCAAAPAPVAKDSNEDFTAGDFVALSGHEGDDNVMLVLELAGGDAQLGHGAARGRLCADGGDAKEGGVAARGLSCCEECCASQLASHDADVFCGLFDAVPSPADAHLLHFALLELEADACDALDLSFASPVAPDNVCCLLIAWQRETHNFLSWACLKWHVAVPPSSAIGATVPAIGGGGGAAAAVGIVVFSSSSP